MPRASHIPDEEVGYQGSLYTKAQLTSMRLADRAERLLEQAMAENNSHKHKWATGKEKWEALQREGAKAAGVTKQGRGRPAKLPPSPAEQLISWLERLALYQGWLIDQTYGASTLEAERLSLLSAQQSLTEWGLVTDEFRQLAEAILGQ